MPRTARGGSAVREECVFAPLPSDGKQAGDGGAHESDVVVGATLGGQLDGGGVKGQPNLEEFHGPRWR